MSHERHPSSFSRKYDSESSGRFTNSPPVSSTQWVAISRSTTFSSMHSLALARSATA